MIIDVVIDFNLKVVFVRRHENSKFIGKNFAPWVLFGFRSSVKIMDRTKLKLDTLPYFYKDLTLN